MSDYEKALSIMKKIFAKDYQFALATAVDNIPSLRFVDTYFDGDNFYIATYASSQKVKEIAVNPKIALCGRKMHNFNGTAYNIGHPLLPENELIREKLVKAFNSWYFKHNNEENDDMCYLRIEPSSGFFHYDGVGYKVNFEDRTVEKFLFSFDTVLTEE